MLASVATGHAIDVPERGLEGRGLPHQGQVVAPEDVQTAGHPRGEFTFVDEPATLVLVAQAGHRADVAVRERLGQVGRDRRRATADDGARQHGGGTPGKWRHGSK